MIKLLQIFKKDPIVTILILMIIIGAMVPKNPIIAEIIKEHNQVEQKSRLYTIEYYYPYLTYFAEIVRGLQQPKPEWMNTYYMGRPYIFGLYYQKAVEMFPDNDAVHYLYGFCKYYEGDLAASLAEYERSIKLNPYFFWSYYNLGVIYFKQGDYLKSAQTLSKGLSLKKEFAMEILGTSSFYTQIWRYITNPSPVLERNLYEAHEDAALLLAVYYVKAGQYAQAQSIFQAVGQGSAWHKGLWVSLLRDAVSYQTTSKDMDHYIQDQIPVRLF